MEPALVDGDADSPAVDNVDVSPNEREAILAEIAHARGEIDAAGKSRFGDMRIGGRNPNNRIGRERAILHAAMLSPERQSPSKLRSSRPAQKGMRRPKTL